MKLYRIDYTNHATGKDRRLWIGTKADAKSTYLGLCGMHERFNVDKPVQVDVPTDKLGLMDWLNDERNVSIGD